MKILKHKNITGIILGLLLLMPFLSILARSAYVVVNKNAYQSYYGETINESEIIIPTSLETNIDYYMSTNTNTFTSISESSNYIYCSEINYNDTLYENVRFGFYAPSSSAVLYCYIRDYSDLNTLYTSFALSNTLVNSISFTIISSNLNDLTPTDLNIYYYEYNNYSYLDNVFEYSVSNFVEDNNIGNLDLTSWFFDIFLEDNSVNNLYVNFSNWYMNYAMLITLMHFLFLVLMWFINYSRRLLDRGMNYDW